MGAIGRSERPEGIWGEDALNTEKALTHVRAFLFLNVSAVSYAVILSLKIVMQK